MPKLLIPTESEEQIALFRWAEFTQSKYPELRLLHHIPNGGKRDVRVASKLKKEGVKSGVPDLHLPVARGKYHSLYIELKCKGNKPTPNQEEWLAALSEQGNAVAVCYGWESAKEKIEEYLKL